MAPPLHLSAGYGERVVLDGVALAVPERRTLAVLGPGGSGKSTLLRALAGESPVPGFWSRREPAGPVAPFAALWQRSEAPPGSLAGGKALLEAFPEASAALAPFAKAPFASLPRAERALAELLLALSAAEGLVLLDEPEAALGPALRSVAERMLQRVKGTRTIVVVTHHLAFARAVADEAVLLEDGRVVEAAPVERFFTAPRVPRTADFLRWGA